LLITNRDGKIIYRGIIPLADDLLYVCQLPFVSFPDFVVSFRWISFSYFTDFVSFRFLTLQISFHFVGFRFLTLQISLDFVFVSFRFGSFKLAMHSGYKLRVVTFGIKRRRSLGNVCKHRSMERSGVKCFHCTHVLLLSYLLGDNIAKIFPYDKPLSFY
jgi:hypothetical protein